jgi:hypothetical protein
LQAATTDELALVVIKEGGSNAAFFSLNPQRTLPSRNRYWPNTFALTSSAETVGPFHE